MSGLINIAGTTSVEDPAYRYKMPRLQAKVEGRGNGIKTVLVNVIDLGLALNRDSPEITKFFGSSFFFFFSPPFSFLFFLLNSKKNINFLSDFILYRM